MASSETGLEDKFPGADDETSSSLDERREGKDDLMGDVSDEEAALIARFSGVGDAERDLGVATSTDKSAGDVGVATFAGGVAEVDIGVVTSTHSATGDLGVATFGVAEGDLGATSTGLATCESTWGDTSTTIQSKHKTEKRKGLVLRENVS